MPLPRVSWRSMWPLRNPDCQPASWQTHPERPHTNYKQLLIRYRMHLTVYITVQTSVKACEPPCILPALRSEIGDALAWPILRSNASGLLKRRSLPSIIPGSRKRVDGSGRPERMSDLSKSALFAPASSQPCLQGEEAPLISFLFAAARSRSARHLFLSEPFLNGH
ncbi:MAG: hypothetical protein JWL59_281 [Chthoniobacteraceae bacterium]|nr:hypothetical protein [Chthoniobacteraceae bacterium]